MYYYTLNKLSHKQVTYFIFPYVTKSNYNTHPRIKKSVTDINFGLYLHEKYITIVNFCLICMSIHIAKNFSGF